MSSKKVFFSRESDEWETPQALFDELNDEFGFTLDPCAQPHSHKCNKYYTSKEDGLLQSWKNEIVFVNPPYSQIKLWAMKASKEKALSVFLIPARTDTKWFHEYFYKKENATIRFLRGRVKFQRGATQTKSCAPFPSMVVIFDNRERET